MLVSACFFAAQNRILRSKFRIEYFAANEMWSKVLAETHEIPLQEYSVFICHDANRALYHTGRLMHDLFSYPQFRHLLILTSGPEVYVSYLKQSNLAYEMGDMNKAEHYAHESLELVEYNPEALKLLAKISIVKRQPDNARVFLNLLRRDFIYRDWADRYLAGLEEDPFLVDDTEIQNTRSLMPIADAVEMPTTDYDYFMPLLLSNRPNRMAFEYYVTSLLLGNQFNPVAGAVSSLDTYGYPTGTIPRHFQEALLVSQHSTGRRPRIGDRIIEVDNIGRFNDFLRRIAQYPSRSAAKEALADDYGDTYYYYSYFGRRIKW